MLGASLRMLEASAVEVHSQACGQPPWTASVEKVHFCGFADMQRSTSMKHLRVHGFCLSMPWCTVPQSRSEPIPAGGRVPMYVFWFLLCECCVRLLYCSMEVLASVYPSFGALPGHVLESRARVCVCVFVPCVAWFACVVGFWIGLDAALCLHGRL